MTLANRITIGRLLLIPVFVVLVMTYTRDEPILRIMALSVFIIAALSDALDGFIARAYDQKTRLGAVLDPLADKLMVNVSFIFLAVNDQFDTQVPPWLPVIVLSRDIFIVLGSYIINEYYGPVRVRPRLLGKLNTFFQMAAIVGVLLQFPFAYEVLMIMLTVTVISLVDYVYAGSKQVQDENHG